MNKPYTWLEGMYLTELRKQQKIIDIRKQYNLRENQFLKKEETKKLVEILAGMEELGISIQGLFDLPIIIKMEKLNNGR